MKRKLTATEQRLAYYAPGAFYIYLRDHLDNGGKVETLVRESLKCFIDTNYETQRELEAIGRACARALNLTNPGLPRLDSKWNPVSYLEQPKNGKRGFEK